MKKYLVMLFLFLCAPAQAVEVAGVKLADTVQLGMSNLQLNGAGTRSKFFFKVYVGALYLRQPQTSAQAIIADENAHRIALHMLRELSSKKLLSAFNEVIEANHTQAEQAELAIELNQMTEIFNQVKEVKAGDVITLDYVPDSGTQISVNGLPQGTIAGKAFNSALLKIWLGEKPAQDDLKLKMLGQ